jgi:hypothetical protein
MQDETGRNHVYLRGCPTDGLTRTNPASGIEEFARTGSVTDITMLGAARVDAAHNGASICCYHRCLFALFCRCSGLVPCNYCNSLMQG